MSFQTEAFNKHPAQWVQINPPKGKNTEIRTLGRKTLRKQSGWGEEWVTQKTQELKRLQTSHQKSYDNGAIWFWSLQNHERKFIWRKKHQDKLISKCLDRRKTFSCMWSLNMFYLLDTLAEKANGGCVTPRRGRKLGKMIWNQRGEENRQDDGRGRSQDGSWTLGINSITSHNGTRQMPPRKGWRPRFLGMLTPSSIV